MIDGFFMRRLSGKLLVLTILFVMVAEIVLLVPSIALYRQSWLADRAQAAGLLTLAIEGVPNYEGGKMLAHQFMQDTDVFMVAQKRDGMSQVVLGMPPKTDSPIYLADLRTPRRLPQFRESIRDFFGDEPATIRILSAPTVTGVDALEILVPRTALKEALKDYCHRILLWSLFISLFTGLMIYAALTLIIVRPIRKLAGGLEQFRQDPRKQREGSHTQDLPSLRTDEIGKLEREFSEMKTDVRGAFRQQERLATLGMAMAKINHDLRNVLTSAQLISDRLASDPDERIMAMGERLVRSVDRGVKLCEATLSFSQSATEKPEPRPVRIAALIGEAASDSIADSRDIQFKNNVPTELSVFSDPDHTYRIFYNLLRNAVQAMQSHKTTSGKSIFVTADVENGKAVFTLTDTGPGIPPKVQDSLFKAFTSGAKKGGTGLGLTIARELARAQGGNLALLKTGKTGTEFLINLPMAPQKSSQQKGTQDD